MKRSMRIAVVVATTTAMMSAAAVAVVGIEAAVSPHAGDTTIVAEAAVPATSTTAVSSPVELTPPAPSDFSVPAIDKALRVVSQNVTATASASATTTASGQTSTSVTATAPKQASGDDSGESDHQNENENEHEGQDD